MARMSPAMPGDSSRIGVDLNDDGYDDVSTLSLPAETHRHLMEMESSFRVDSDLPGPIGRQHSAETIGGALFPPHEEESEPDTSMVGDSTSVQGQQRRRSESIAAIVSQDTSGASSPFEDITSSPTAAAAVRNISRAATASENLNEMFRAQDEATAERLGEVGAALERVPSRVPSRVSSRASRVSSRGGGGSRAEARPPSAATNSKSSSTALPRPVPTKTSVSNPNNPHATSTTIPTPATASHKRRPKFLRSKDTSQRSSISSVSDMQGGDDDRSTITVGDAERQALSRQNSLGSIASGITTFGGGSVYGGDRTMPGISAADRALARLDEEERNSRRGSFVGDMNGAESTDDDDKKERPITPKERTPPLPQPTETAIAAQVRNVRVPPTITREFSRHLGAPGSPSKKAVAAAGTPATAARGREMTLKEQTASIDRLQKENFDLKIKVYYLNEKLEKQSDEGVKEALQENIDMKVRLAEGMRERKSLKKRIRELEKKVEELGGEKEREEEASAAAESEEIWELRETIERYELEIEEYRRRDAERGERMRDFRRQANGHQVNEELEHLRDLLATETAHREAQEAENIRLREEMSYRLRADHPAPLSRATSRSVSDRDHSQSRADHGLMVQLNQSRRENEELRREVSAQASMLTSRNREKERLYSEIEDLKITMRNGGSAPAFENASRAPSVFSDRLLDRSVSRAGGIVSAAGTHVSTAITESEREDFENTNGALRDRISELRLKNSDMEQQLEDAYVELEQRREELDAAADELDLAQAEIQEMQNERNDALRIREEIEMDFEQLKEEAEEELRRLEEELDARGNEILRLEDELRNKEEDLRNKEEDFRAIQQELRNVSDAVVRFEDQQEMHHGESRRYEERIQELERTIRENEQEMTVLENSLREGNEKMERLSVQGESAKGEIAFLREEQDGDKIKIGELQSTIKQLEKMVEDERDKVREARQQMDAERDQREHHGDLRQQEWERRLNEKSQELTAAKDEVRKLKGKVCNREDEAKTWRERLEDLERGLREALGDLGGTRTGLMQSVLNLQHELDATLEELDVTRNELAEKGRNLKDRENLLESMALESRKLTDLLEKERNLRSHDKNALEILQSTSSQVSRRISQHQQQSEVAEKQRVKEARSLKALEEQYREQISERNSVLLQVWTRLSAVCGHDWSSRNSLVTTSGITSGVTDGKISMDAAITSAFPAFTRNLISAVKTIESLFAGFKTKCRGVERDLWKEYQVIESALEQRTRRLERLESLVRGGLGEANEKTKAEAVKLRTENRTLKAEISVMKQERAKQSTVPQPATPTTPTTSSSIPTPGQQPHVKRSHTTSSSKEANHQHRPMALARADTTTATADGGEKRWILRLRELEKRLKAEREARLLDRSMANKKIQETRGEKEEIRRELERERVRSASGTSGASS